MSDFSKSNSHEQDKPGEASDKAETQAKSKIDSNELQKKHEDKKDSNEDPSLSKIDIQFKGPRSQTALGFPIGQGPPFMLKKSEFLKPDHDKSQHHELKNLISNFLNDTKLVDENKLSNKELKELASNRDQLSSARSVPDAILSALQLKRMYQEMKYLEEAKKARDLILGLDPNNQVGKQLFKELERMQTQEFGSSTATVSLPHSHALSKTRLKGQIQAMSGGRVIVLGDLLIDELLEGRPERISREAPVLILEHVGTELILGGAANAAANLAALGGNCHTIGVCGRDEYAYKLGRLFEKAGISYSLVEDPSRPTTVKTRILSSAHALRQQLIRLDRISHEKLNNEVAKSLLDRFDAVASSYDAVILSDYRSGLITDLVVQGTLEIAQRRNLKVVVDAQDNFPRFRGAALITPNQPDTEAAVGFKIESKESIADAGKKLLQISGAHNLLLTRGGAGMVLFQENEPMFELPAFNRSEVFDVTGAGDTVVATMTLAMVTGATMTEAMALGNLAAGIVVKKVGTAVTNQTELLEALENLKIAD